MTARILITIAPDGTVAAKTKGMYGDRCLDYIPVLENLLEATAADSSYTADYTRAADRAHEAARDLEQA
ncbi:MAG: DUF2997 domain-containing protein [Micromonosporaceae bacterium]|nr:DUF2997 domain-containing protein [Micromonosporaceae bacterium]